MPKSVEIITLPSGATVTLKLDVPLKMKEFRQWIAAERDGDFDAVYPFMTRFIADWSLDLPTDDPESFDELDLGDYIALTEAIGDVIQRKRQRKN